MPGKFMMVAIYGNDFPSYDNIMRWKRNFQSGQMSLTEEPRPGRPPWMNDEECLIMEDRCPTIMDETCLSYGSV